MCMCPQERIIQFVSSIYCLATFFVHSALADEFSGSSDVSIETAKFSENKMESLNDMRVVTLRVGSHQIPELLRPGAFVDVFSAKRTRDKRTTVNKVVEKVRVFAVDFSGDSKTMSLLVHQDQAKELTDASERGSLKFPIVYEPHAKKSGHNKEDHESETTRIVTVKVAHSLPGVAKAGASINVYTTDRSATKMLIENATVHAVERSRQIVGIQVPTSQLEQLIHAVTVGKLHISVEHTTGHASSRGDQGAPDPVSVRDVEAIAPKRQSASSELAQEMTTLHHEVKALRIELRRLIGLIEEGAVSGDQVKPIPQMRDSQRWRENRLQDNVSKSIWNRLGLALVSADLSHESHKGYRRGLAVQCVRPDSPADDAGIRVNDIVVGFDKRATETVAELYHIMTSRETWKPNQTLKF